MAEEKLKNGKTRYEGLAFCCEHGSATRSCSCPIESGYVAFKINEATYRFYNEDRMWEFSERRYYSIRAILTQNRTLQRVETISCQIKKIPW